MPDQPQVHFAQCSYCLLPYPDSSVKAVGATKKGRVMHLTCQYCLRSMLISVLKTNSGLTCAGIFTDLDYEEAVRFRQAEKISVDDVLHAHHALKFDNFLEMR